MEIVDNRALRLQLRNPTTVTTVIPKSKQTGPNEVLVHWGVDETRSLRELNIKAPAPISGRYDWPGQHKPMAHQRTTAEFLTMNKRAFCFNEQGCVDSETEYLSPTGWVKISEYTGGKVAQYDPSLKEIEFVEPDEYVKLPCADMIRIKTKYGVDQLLSPEHRVLLEDGKSDHCKTETVSAEILSARHHMYHEGHREEVGGTKSGTDTIAFSSATIPSTFRYIPKSKMPYSDAELRVLVATIADGYFGSGTKHCAVRLKKDRKKLRLRDILDRAGIEYVEKPCNPDGFSKFTFYAPERWKEFGPEFWKASSQQIDIITSEVLYWDGCTTRGERFSTSSKASADFIQFAFSSQRSAGGGTARVTCRERRGGVEYTVQVRRGTERLYLRGTDATMNVEPSTDGFKYCFKVPTTYLLFRRNGCVFLSGNTGKTASAIWAADFLMKQKLVRRVLVVCPLSIMDSAWRADLFTFAMHRTVDIAYGAAAKRKKIVNSAAEFIIINYDGIGIVEEEIRNGAFDLIIVDEASHYKNSQSKRWKILHRLLTPDTWLWLMTGTPAAQSPVDAYGLAKLVTPSGVPRYYGSFRDMVQFKITPFKWANKADAVSTVHRVLQPAIRFSKDECLDLPDIVYTKRHVPMTKQQEAYYAKLKKDMVMEAAGAEITAVNAAIKMNKLLQISAGAVYTDDGDTLEFDISERYKVLREVIDESSKKVLIFVPFKSTIRMLTERLRADGVSTETISGDVSAGNRTEIFKRFQTEADPRVLVIQPQAAAHGVTLTAANTIVWWAPTSSLETYAQANARIHRSGQTSKCTVVQLESSQVERRIYSLLDGRIDVHAKVLDLYKDLLD
jgi:superfamily II DNA or RNA helicase